MVSLRLAARPGSALQGEIRLILPSLGLLIHRAFSFDNAIYPRFAREGIQCLAVWAFMKSLLYLAMIALAVAACIIVLRRPVRMSRNND